MSYRPLRGVLEQEFGACSLRTMKIAMLRELHEKRPFVPFIITMADGRKLNVIHNEFLYIFPSGRAAMLTHRDDRFTLIDLLMVTTLDIDPNYRTRRAKPAAKKR